MELKITANKFGTDVNHTKTSYKVLDRDLVEITTEEGVDNERYEKVLTIDDSYKDTPIYTQITYTLDGEDISESLVGLTNGEKDILEYTPPMFDYVVEDGILTLTFKEAKRYLSLNSLPVKVHVKVSGIINNTILLEDIVDSKIDIPLFNLPTYISIIDIESRWMYGDRKVSNASRKSILLKEGLFTLSNVKYTLGMPFSFKVLVEPLGYVETDDTLFYAKVFSNEEVVPMLPAADDPTSFSCVMPNLLTNAYVVVKGKVGGTLMSNKIKLKEV